MRCDALIWRLETRRRLRANLEKKVLLSEQKFAFSPASDFPGRGTCVYREMSRCCVFRLLRGLRSKVNAAFLFYDCWIFL